MRKHLTEAGRVKRTIIAFTLAALLGVACTMGSLSRYAGSWVAPEFDIQNYETIAILPIVNLTNNASADIQVPQLLAEELRALTQREFRILSPIDVEVFLQNEGLQDSITEKTSYADLCRWLGVDGLFDVIVGVYGYERGKEPGLVVPYTTYLYVRLTNYRQLALRNVDLRPNREDLSLPPETRYVETPDSVCDCATAEIQLCLYEAEDGESVFSVVDVRSSAGERLGDVARTLIRAELTAALEREENTAWPFFPRNLSAD
jgi:hypothetical protein